MTADSKEKPFGIKDKLGYMFGDFGNDFTFIFASSFLMVFYTNVLGIDPKMVGVLFLVARVVDAFTDIGMGRIVDRLPSSRDGKFRPWIKRICVPVAFASFLMYQSSLVSASMTVKIIYMFVTYILWGSILYTAINIPYGSMASAITDNPRQRAELSTFRSMGATFASVVIMMVAPVVVYYKDENGNQIVSPTNFTLIAGAFGVLAVICYILCYQLTRERVKIEKVNGGKMPGLGETFYALFSNRALLAIIGAAIFLLLSSLMGQSMNNYLFAEWFKNTGALSVMGFVGVPTSLILAVFTGKITEKFGKKEAGAAGMLFTGIVFILLFLFKVRNPWVFVGVTFLGNFGMYYFNMVVWAYITDVIDYQEMKTGNREDGTVYGVYSFARKIGQALAGGVSGFALSAIGYVSEPGAVQTDSVREGIYNIATIFPGLCYVIVALILIFAYPLSKNVVQRNGEILTERRNVAAEANGSES
ncbi:MAG: MFS transporter [Lachnospiraceae bacterium]|jgi:GPH family glycoside/pentoside/hexuronide:cation symporter|nr:MFS transporter [Lachnospiraceae bacterium]